MELANLLSGKKQEDRDVGGFSMVPGLAQLRRTVFFLHLSISDVFP